MRIGIEGVDASCTDKAGRRTKLTRSLRDEDCSGASVVVNVFDGGPRTKVTCKIVGTVRNEITTMHTLILSREAITDVAVEDIYARHRDLMKPWVEPAISSHVWRATLPDLSIGTDTAALEIIDEYGRMHWSSLMFERMA